MTIQKFLCSMALPPLLALGCSSGDETTFDNEPVERGAQAIGEATCGTLSDPQATFNGSIPYRADGSVSEASYSRSGCYKAYVVRIDNFSDYRADIVVADANVTSSTWHTPPSGPYDPDIGPIRDFDPGDLSIGTPGPLPLSRAECEALFMRATLYEDGVPKRTVDAHGTYVSPFICTRPSITFGGFNYRSYADSDLFIQGKSYTVAATYRVKDASGAATLPLQILTPPVACGHANLACCYSSAIICDRTTDCISDQCVSCGHTGETPCHYQENGEAYCAYREMVIASDGTCQPCGYEGDLCCGPDVYAGTTCGVGRCGSNGRCYIPGAEPPPTPTPQIDCEHCGVNENDACCPASCSLLCKKSWLACMPGNYCFSPGVTPACTNYAVATLGECYDGSGNLYSSIYTGTTAAGCGENDQVAKLRAGASLALTMCLTNQEEHKTGCCLYAFDR
jgi:hypothetical protein